MCDFKMIHMWPPISVACENFICSFCVYLPCHNCLIRIKDVMWELIFKGSKQDEYLLGKKIK
jgi:hypothetical protein